MLAKCSGKCADDSIHGLLVCLQLDTGETPSSQRGGVKTFSIRRFSQRTRRSFIKGKQGSYIFYATTAMELKGINQDEHNRNFLERGHISIV